MEALVLEYIKIRAEAKAVRGSNLLVKPEL